MSKQKSLRLAAVLAVGLLLATSAPALNGGVHPNNLGKGDAGNATPAAASSLLNLVQYAKPMCGTADGANCFPGAVAPFGMIQWSPDTEAGRHTGGYAYADARISDFSVDHVSGTGCNYGENFAIMPILGAEPAFRRASARLLPRRFRTPTKSPNPAITG